MSCFQYVPRDNGTYNNTQANHWDAGIATFLLEIDLSTNFTNQDIFPYTSIPKSPSVPSGLVEHVLWYSQTARKLYQLGGWFSFNSVTAPNYVPTDQIPPPSIWQLDIDSGNWSETEFDLDNAGSSILHRPGAAANCDAPSLNMSFLFEGYLQQRSESDTVKFTQSSEFQCRHHEICTVLRRADSVLCSSRGHVVAGHKWTHAFLQLFSSQIDQYYGTQLHWTSDERCNGTHSSGEERGRRTDRRPDGCRSTTLWCWHTQCEHCWV
jgi:hypothetical protein